MCWMMDIAVMENEKMDDYISRQAAMNALDRIIPMNYSDWRKGQNVIRTLPAADVAPVRHGRWKIASEETRNGLRYCSECRHGYDGGGIEKWERMAKYCPNCGARMDGDEND